MRNAIGHSPTSKLVQLSGLSNASVSIYEEPP